MYKLTQRIATLHLILTLIVETGFGAPFPSHGQRPSYVVPACFAEQALANPAMTHTKPTFFIPRLSAKFNRLLTLIFRARSPLTMNFTMATGAEARLKEMLRTRLQRKAGFDIDTCPIHLVSVPLPNGGLKITFSMFQHGDWVGYFDFEVSPDQGVIKIAGIRLRPSLQGYDAGKAFMSFAFQEFPSAQKLIWDKPRGAASNFLNSLLSRGLISNLDWSSIRDKATATIVRPDASVPFLPHGVQRQTPRFDLDRSYSKETIDRLISALNDQRTAVITFGGDVFALVLRIDPSRQSQGLELYQLSRQESLSGGFLDVRLSEKSARGNEIRFSSSEGKLSQGRRAILEGADEQRAGRMISRMSERREQSEKVGFFLDPELRNKGLAPLMLGLMMGLLDYQGISTLDIFSVRRRSDVPWVLMHAGQADTAYREIYQTRGYLTLLNLGPSGARSKSTDDEIAGMVGNWKSSVLVPNLYILQGPIDLLMRRLRVPEGPREVAHVVMAVLVFSILEEWFFRGQWLGRWGGDPWGVGLVFVAAHLFSNVLEANEDYRTRSVLDPDWDPWWQQHFWRSIILRSFVQSAGTIVLHLIYFNTGQNWHLTALAHGALNALFLGFHIRFPDQTPVLALSIFGSRLSAAPTAPGSYKVFSGDLSKFTRMDRKRFRQVYTPLLGEGSKDDIDRFSAMLVGTNSIWRHPLDAVDGTGNLIDLYDSLKLHKKFPGICDMASRGVVRIARQNGFQADLVQRQDPVTKGFNNYAEIVVAGKCMIVDLAADFWELEDASPEELARYRSSHQEIAGLLVIPKEAAEEHRDQLPMYAAWPETKREPSPAPSPRAGVLPSPLRRAG